MLKIVPHGSGYKKTRHNNFNNMFYEIIDAQNVFNKKNRTAMQWDIQIK